MSERDYFANELVASLQRGDEVSSPEFISQIRELGFDFTSDGEAFEHFLSEVEEFKEAFENGDRDAMQGEAADIQWMLLEMCRRMGLDLDAGAHEMQLRAARRLAYIENVLERQGKSWKDADYPTELKPLWDQAKEAGL